MQDSNEYSREFSGSQVKLGQFHCPGPELMPSQGTLIPKAEVWPKIDKQTDE